jgi:hypothetical protein
MNLQQILDRAMELAPAGGDANISPSVDSDVTAYMLFPHAVRYVIDEMLRTGKGVEELTQEHIIELVDGVGTIPGAIIKDCLDMSYVPGEQFASYLRNYADYGRYRFDNQMCYYATRGEQLEYSCDRAGLLISPSCIATAGSSTIEHNGDPDVVVDETYVGMRFKLTDENNGLCCDAIIDSITDSTHFVIRGQALQSTSGFDVFVPGGIYNTGNDSITRSVTDLVTGSGNGLVDSASAAFTTSDEGRRLRAMETGSSTPVVDAIITNFISATQVMVGAGALSSQLACDADIMFVGPLTLQSPSIPDLPTNINDDVPISRTLAENVILIIASVLKGEMPLAKLLNGSEK